jgi:hypothetical protein
MAIKATCGCGAAFTAPMELAGKRVKCPKCGQAFVVPDPRQTEPDQTDAFGLPIPGDDPLGLGDSGSTGIADPLAGSDSSLDDFFDESLPHRSDPATTVATCPGCHAPLSPGTIICISCGVHTQTGQRVRTVGETGKKPLPSVPEGITVEESGSQLVIKTRGATQAGFFLVVVPVILLPILGFIGGAVLGSRLVSAASSSLAFPTIVLAVGYALAASFLNRKVIEVDSSQINIRTEGPLPWPNVGSKVAIDNITQLYVVEKRMRRRRYGHGFGHAHYLYGHVHYTYSINVVLRNGWRRRLVLVPDRQGAKYVEKKIESFLSVKDVPVVSTWYQRWLLRESTLYDDRDFDPDTAISAKSMPLPASALVFGCMLLFFVGIGVVISMLRGH